jgi:hypothetical protein
MAITVYNRTKEDHSSHPFNFPIYRGGSILGNPYTHKALSSTLAVYKVRNREEAILRYSSYFDMQYGKNKEFTELIDIIYELYKMGEDIYLECYCDPSKTDKPNCHGEIIIKKLEQRLLKEKIKEARLERYGKKQKMG